MAKLGTITVPVILDVSIAGDMLAACASIRGPGGNTNPSLTNLAAAMNGLSLDEFALLGAYEQGAYRDLAHNLLQVYQVTPR